MKKVMLFGVFDVLHKGHLNLLEQARKYGDYLIVVVARDKTVKKTKGKFPRNDEKQRLKKVKNYADRSVLGYIKDKYKVIKNLKPDIICLGYDQKVSLEELRKFKITIKRLKPYKPNKYKSSKLYKQS